MSSIVVLGFFDSIHIGHVALLNKAKEYAIKNDAKLTILTFDDDLLKNLNNDNKCGREIFLAEERKSILLDYGADEVVFLDTNNGLLEKTPHEFLTYIARYNPLAVFVGEDYKFGKNAAGDVNLLKEWFSEKSVEIVVVKLVCDSNGQKISTWKIKKLIQDGKVKEANGIMTHNYYIRGKIVSGRHVGKTIGIPTANIQVLSNKLLPKSGVYVTRTKIFDKFYASVTNVGDHPTFDDNFINVETHLIDFFDDIYDEQITVEFLEYIRGIEKFNSSDELVKQIEKDIIFAKKVVLSEEK